MQLTITFSLVKAIIEDKQVEMVAFSPLMEALGYKNISLEKANFTKRGFEISRLEGHDVLTKGDTLRLLATSNKVSVEDKTTVWAELTAAANLEAITGSYLDAKKSASQIKEEKKAEAALFDGTSLTEKEKEVLAFIEDALPGYDLDAQESDLTKPALVKIIEDAKSEINPKGITAILNSLVKKNVIWFEEVEKGDNFIHLSGQEETEA